MTIKIATPNQLNHIMQVIDDARAIMRKNGNHTQWINGYPSAAIIFNDTSLNTGYICMHNNEIVGYVSFSKGNNPESTYQIIENGKWLNNEPYGVSHTLAANGKVNGVATACFTF